MGHPSVASDHDDNTVMDRKGDIEDAEKAVDKPKTAARNHRIVNAENFDTGDFVYRRKWWVLSIVSKCLIALTRRP